MPDHCFTALILAAGCGRRAGGYKPLWRIDDRVVIDRVVESAASVCSTIRVVGGFDFVSLKTHLDALVEDHVELIENRKWSTGMFSSVQIGLDGVNTPVFVHPADIAGVSASVYQTLADAADMFHGDHVFRPMHRGRVGHPILLMPQAVSLVRQARPDSNLRNVLKSVNPQRDISVEDELILYDFDTPAEFRLLEKLISGVF